MKIKRACFKLKMKLKTKPGIFPGGLKEKVIIGSFVNIILPVQSALPTILRYIYKKKKKEVEQVDTSLKRTKRNNMYICLILRECHGIYAYAEAAMACPCNCSLLRLLAVSCIFLYGMGKVCS